MSAKRIKPSQSVEITEEDFGEDSLTAKQIRFIQEFCVDFNQTGAALRAGYSEHTAAAIGHENMKKPSVMSAIKRRMAALAAAAEVDSNLVISELYEIAMADPRELMSVEVDSCRHCYGIDHKYQWTEPEYRRELKSALSAGRPAPEIEGYFGFDPRREPHPDCPSCHGRGVERVAVTPSRKLSKGAAKLMASVKQTKDGCIELKTHNKMDALIALGRAVGVFKDRQELSGPGGAPLQLQPVQPLEQLTPEQLEAIIRASGHPVLQGHPATAPLTPHQLEAITSGGNQ